MLIVSAPHWDEYTLLDTGRGKRLERFGKYVLVRPDPQVIWNSRLSEKAWNQAGAIFQHVEHGKDRWIKKSGMPDSWIMQYKSILFQARLSPFKHTGVFPEQAAQWDWFANLIDKEKRTIRVLNLFAYTGLASLVAAAHGASVTHVDASKPALAWAHENQELSKLTNKPIRWILDDALKFTKRELKRGKNYDAIIMDPPVYGHGPQGEKWDFNTSFPELLHICSQLLSERPVFFLVNAYAISSSSLMLQNILTQELSGLKGNIETGELVLQEENNGRLLSTGIFGRWSKS